MPVIAALTESAPLLLAKASTIASMWFLLAGSLYAIAFPSLAWIDPVFTIDESVVRLMAVCLGFAAAVILVDHYGVIDLKIAR